MPASRITRRWVIKVSNHYVKINDLQAGQTFEVVVNPPDPLEGRNLSGHFFAVRVRRGLGGDIIAVDARRVVPSGHGLLDTTMESLYFMPASTVRLVMTPLR